MPPNSREVGALLPSTVKGTNAQRKGDTALESPDGSTLLSSSDDQGLTSWDQSDSRVLF